MLDPGQSRLVLTKRSNAYQCTVLLRKEISFECSLRLLSEPNTGPHTPSVSHVHTYSSLKGGLGCNLKLSGRASTLPPRGQLTSAQLFSALVGPDVHFSLPYSALISWVYWVMIAHQHPVSDTSVSCQAFRRFQLHQQCKWKLENSPFPHKLTVSQWASCRENPDETQISLLVNMETESTTNWRSYMVFEASERPRQRKLHFGLYRRWSPDISVTCRMN